MPDKSKLTEKELRKVIPYCISYAQVLCKIGLAPRGGNYATLKRKIFEYKIDISHFKGKGWNTGLRFKPNQVVSIHEILVEGSSYQSFKLKKRLLAEKLKERKCESCGLTRWLSKPIALELHHINGVANDNRLENLQLLCPNCHALTDNYRGKNAGKEYF